MKQTEARVQSAKTNSRLKDNHFDPNVHNRAWIAPGIFNQLPKYEHLDSGLVVLQQKSNKMKKYRELSEINDQIMQMQQEHEFRKFKEFENLQNGDLIITIEYCTNCSQHSGSTRHDEEKYYSYASNLKQEIISQYPTGKVYLKPLIYDPQDQSVDTLYIQRRIGAFEVQVCSKNRDAVKKGVVFSKLSTKMWPNYQEVIDNISNYLSTTSVEIYLTFGEGITGNLNNIEITLAPHRNEQRPQSSVSRTSNQSKRSNRTKMDRKMRVLTNQQGKIKIEDIPLDVYVVEIIESNDYQSEQLLMNLLEMVDNNQEMSVVVKLKKQTHSYLNIKVMQQKEYLVEISDAKVTVTHQQSLENMQARELGNARYESIVDPGEYTVTVEYKGSKPFEKNITALQGVNEVLCVLEIDLNEQQKQVKPPTSAKQLQPLPKPTSARPTSASKSSSQAQLQMQKQQQQQQQPQIMENTKTEDAQQSNIRPISGFKTTMVFIYDPYTNQPISGVTVTLNEDSTRNSTTYTTDQEGTCKMILQGVLEGKMVIQMEGYFPIVEEYGTTPSRMNLYQLRELSFPLIRQPQNQDSVFILVQTNVETMPIDLKVIMPDNVQADSTHLNVEFDFNEESGCLKVHIKDIPQKRGVYRIMADIIEPEYVHPQTLKVYIINNKELKLVDVPKNIQQDQLYWDIGVICAPNSNFLEINTPTNELLKKDKYLKEYQTLLQFLRNSKNMDLKTILGFNDKEKLELQGDVFVQREKIHQSLDKYGFEQIRNLDYLIQSAIMSNGLFSFKRLEQKFSNLDFEFIFEDEISTSKQKEESDDEPYDDDYDI